MFFFFFFFSSRRRHTRLVSDWSSDVCSSDLVPAAAVKAPTNAGSEEASAPTPDSSGRYFAFGPSSATIAFIGSKVTGRHNGGFSKFAGEFRAADGRLADTGNKVVIDTSSLFA